MSDVRPSPGVSKCADELPAGKLVIFSAGVRVGLQFDAKGVETGLLTSMSDFARTESIYPAWDSRRLPSSPRPMSIPRQYRASLRYFILKALDS